LPLSRRIVVSLGLVGPLWAGALVAAPRQIRLRTIPSLEQARPMAEPVRLSLAVLDEGRRPVANARIGVRLFSPEPGRFFSTDRPLVEGTQLLEFEITSASGATEWEYLFPIRGKYRLEVTAADGRGGRLSQTFDLRIRESRKKLVLLFVFSAALFSFGFAAGRALSGRPRRGLGGAAAALGLALGAAPEAGATELDAAGRLEVGPAVVGRMSEIRWTPAEAGTHAGEERLASLAIEHMETGKRLLLLPRAPVGAFAIGFQFFDGAPHRVTVLEESGGRETLRAERVVEVGAPHPPRSAVLPAFLFFFSLLAAGLAAGRASQRWRER
jgi:hypothetical protein